MSGKLAGAIPGKACVVHDARLAHIPRTGLVQQAAVVPQYGVTRCPRVVVDARRLAGELGQLIEQVGPRETIAGAGVVLFTAALVLRATGRLAGLDIEVGTYEPAAAAEAHPPTPTPPPNWPGSGAEAASRPAAGA